MVDWTRFNLDFSLFNISFFFSLFSTIELCLFFVDRSKWKQSSVKLDIEISIRETWIDNKASVIRSLNWLCMLYHLYCNYDLH